MTSADNVKARLDKQQTITTHSFDQKIRLVFKGLTSNNSQGNLGFEVTDLQENRNLLCHVGVILDTDEEAAEFFTQALRPIKGRVVLSEFLQVVVEKASQQWQTEETKQQLLASFATSVEGGVEGAYRFQDIFSYYLSSEDPAQVPILPLAMHLLQRLEDTFFDFGPSEHYTVEDQVGVGQRACLIMSASRFNDVLFFTLSA